jgi:hypothetical protein
LTAVVWEDQQHVNILANTHCLSAERNFCGEYGYALKPTTVQITQIWEYIDKSDHMTVTPLADTLGNGQNNYSFSTPTISLWGSLRNDYISYQSLLPENLS